MKATYDAQPLIYQPVGNGSYMYRWNIHAIESPIMDTEETVTMWECQEVTVWPTVTKDKLTEKVVTELWPVNYEQKLINDYNAAQAGIVTGETAELYITRYIDMLEQRKAIKEQIAVDCETLGIY